MHCFPTTSIGYRALEHGVRAMVVAGVESAIRDGIDSALESLLNEWTGASNMVDERSSGALTPLHIAAEVGRDSMIQILLNHNASIEASDSFQRTALHIASLAGHVECVNILIKNGAKPDVPDLLGRSPLHLAVKHGHVRTVELLLDTPDIMLNCCDINRWTPLHYCAEGNHHSIAHNLLAHNATSVVPIETGQSPIHIAASENASEMIDLLLKDRSSRTLLDAYLSEDLMVKHPLECAVLNGAFGAVATLLQAGSGVTFLKAMNRDPTQIRRFRAIMDEIFDRIGKHSKSIKSLAQFDSAQNDDNSACDKASSKIAELETKIEKDIGIMDLLFASGWDLIIPDFCGHAARLGSRVAKEKIAVSAATRSLGGSVPSLLAQCRERVRVQLGTSVSLIPALKLPQTCKNVLVYNVHNAIVPRCKLEINFTGGKTVNCFDY